MKELAKWLLGAAALFAFWIWADSEGKEPATKYQAVMVVLVAGGGAYLLSRQIERLEAKLNEVLRRMPPPGFSDNDQ